MLYLTNQSQVSWLFSIQQPQKAFDNTSVRCHATFYLEKATFLLVFDIARVARVFDLPYRPGRKLGRLGQIQLLKLKGFPLHNVMTADNHKLECYAAMPEDDDLNK